MIKIDGTKLYSIFLHIALSFSIFQLICPVYTLVASIRADYISICAMLLIIFKYVLSIGIRPFIDSVFSVLESTKYLAIFIGGYFVWDSINSIYAIDKIFLIDKYLIWAKILVLCMCIIIYVNPFWEKVNSKQKVNNVLLNLGTTCCAISIIAYIGYYTGIYTYRIRMLITISDHNVFSSMLMIGLVVFAYYIMSNNKISFKRKLILVILVFVICAPAMYLSASRRTIILLYAFSLCFFLYCICKAMRTNNWHKKAINIVNVLLSCIIIIVLFNAHVSFFNDFSTKRYTALIENQQNTEIKQETTIDKEETSNIVKEEKVDYYVETIADGSGLNLRKEIWSTSLKWFTDMSSFEKIVGGGGSYQSDIFNNIQHPYNKNLVEHYGIKDGQTRWMGPHNFLLEDLLSGGLVKFFIVILVMISALIYSIKIWKKDRDMSIMMLTLYAVLLINLLMGGKYGLFGDRITWFVITIHFMEQYIVEKYCKSEKNS